MIHRLFKKKKLYKAVYNPESSYREFGYVDENVIGYFESVEQFKEAVLKRWANTHRDVPILSQDKYNLVKVNFGTEGRITSSNFIVLREIRPVGFKYEQPTVNSIEI